MDREVATDSETSRDASRAVFISRAEPSAFRYRSPQPFATERDEQFRRS
jgi:hypothetical protein